MEQEIIVKFGYRWYIFYSQRDITKATAIWAYNTGNQDDFEGELKSQGVIFSKDILSWICSE